MFRLRPEAIAKIADHIRLDSLRAVLRWTDDIFEKCRLLGEMPGIGSPHYDVLAHLCVLVVGRYLILYREVGPEADILRIVHGARDWGRLV